VQELMQTEVDRIVDQLQREHNGDPWHGPPLLQILDGVTPDQAAARPVRGAHSIWELVLHITAWKNEVRRRVNGGAAGEPEEGDWPMVGEPSPERWSEALTLLEGAHQRLVADIQTLRESRLLEPTNDPRQRELGSGVSYYVLLHGVAQHDVYHAGQIGILKRALGL
jgi:uncharacterized damage-inducible protein DinB